MIYATFGTCIDGRPSRIAHISSADAVLEPHVRLTSPEQIKAAFDAEGVERVKFYFWGFPRRAVTREKARALYAKMFRDYDPTPEQRAKNEARMKREREKADAAHRERMAGRPARSLDDFADC